MIHCLKARCWFSAGLCYFEVESVVFFSCFFDFEDFKVSYLAGVFDVGIFARGFVKAFDLYDSDFFYGSGQSG